MTCILLTGSSRGIGAAAKSALEARGAKVIGQATTSDRTDTVPADFSEPFAARELWDAALARAATIGDRWRARAGRSTCW